MSRMINTGEAAGVNLAVNMLFYCFWSCDKTKEMTGHQIQQLLLSFFTVDELNAARLWLTNPPAPPTQNGGGHG